MGQVLPFLSQEHQQQVATAVERAKQVTMAELNTVIGVSISLTMTVVVVLRMQYTRGKKKAALQQRVWWQRRRE